jgi:predicted short-subunit dehydrogenase-like oxidoreductase (DUF2520 family)
MGLGRHRSAIHGVASKRQIMRQGSLDHQVKRGDVAALAKRLKNLEERHEQLMDALMKALREGRR